MIVLVWLVLRPNIRVGTVGSQLTVGNGTHINYKNVLTEFHSKGKRLGTNTGAVSRLLTREMEAAVCLTRMTVAAVGNI